MAWQSRKIQVTAASDIHCGDMPLGFVTRTFPFVPCHIPFFAMIPAAVSALGLPDEHKSYADLEKFFTQCLRTTPLYVSEKEILFPWQKDSLSELESRFLGVRQGVCLDNKTRAAEESKLFETEVILCFPRPADNTKANSCPLQLEGVVFWKEFADERFRLDVQGILHYGSKEKSLQDILRDATLGGGQSHGLGSVSDVALTSLDNEKAWGKWEVQLDAEFPEIKVPSQEEGPVPLKYTPSESSSSVVSGAMCLLTGRRYKDKTNGHGGSGLAMEKEAVPAWKAGWKNTKQDTITAKLSAVRFASLD